MQVSSLGKSLPNRSFNYIGKAQNLSQYCAPKFSKFGISAAIKLQRGAGGFLPNTA